MPNPSQIVSIDGAGRALLYDLDELVEVGYLLGDQRGSFIGYSVGDGDGTVWVGQTDTWYNVPLAPEVWRQRACDLAGREPTDEE